MSSLRPAVAVMAAAFLALSANAAGKVTVKTARNHRGWTNAVVLSNGHVEAVVVPSVGRLMQFRFATAVDGPLWENPQLLGKPMPEKPWEAAHGSFGGDKTALVDASHEKFRGLYLDTLRAELAARGRGLDYLVVSHTEPDHSGARRAGML